MLLREPGNGGSDALRQRAVHSAGTESFRKRLPCSHADLDKSQGKARTTETLELREAPGIRGDNAAWRSPGTLGIAAIPLSVRADRK